MLQISDKIKQNRLFQVSNIFDEYFKVIFTIKNEQNGQESKILTIKLPSDYLNESSVSSLPRFN